MPKELPILICTDLIPAIMDGRKSVTRRVIKIDKPEFYREAIMLSDGTCRFNGYGTADFMFFKPRYSKGDLLWVKETFWLRNHGNTYRGLGIDYKAGGHSKHILKPKGVKGLCKWKSSRFMPKWAARTWLKVLDVRAERLQEISHVECYAEGIESQFSANPWVWRYEFKVR